MRPTLAPCALALLLAGALSTGCSNAWKSGSDGPGEQDGSDTGDLGGTDDGGADDSGEGTDSGDSGADSGGDTGEDDFDGDGYTESDGDCDDTDPEIHPGAEEICDGIDNDCDGTSDADLDDDGDGVKDCEDFCPIQVNIASPTGGDGSFATPFNAIQDGIDLAPVVGCYEVEVHPGTYYENIDFLGYDVDVYSVSGPDYTTIDGSGAGSVVTFEGGESSAARIYGFTITNGAATEGAGIYVLESDPTIQGNRITDNTTSAYPHLGGGIAMTSASPDIFDNEITDNDAGYGLDEEGSDGGAIKARLGAPTIYGNVITGNTAGDGGGLWMAYADALIYQNVIADNDAHDTDSEKGGQGGGMDLQIATDDFFFMNNIVQDNTASMYGGGVAVYENHEDYGEGTLANNVIAFNDVTDTSYGGGLAIWSTCTPDVYNNLLYGNGTNGLYTANDDAWIAYNDSYANDDDWAGSAGELTGSSGNISSNPQVGGVSDDGDWSNDDWTLNSSSPLVNAGWSSVTDPDGTRSDIGAYGGTFGAW